MTQSGDPKAKRLLKMLFLLQSGRRYDIARLAKDFRVSRRTIFRDVATLKGAGVPIRFDEVAHSFVVERNPPGVCELTYDDVALLLLGARSSIRCELPDASEELETAVHRLLGNLEDGVRDRAIGLMERVFVEPEVAFRTIRPRADIVVAVAKALSSERRVYFVVDDRQRKVEWRFRFAPYQLRVQTAGWSVIGASEIHPRPCLVNLAHVQRASVTEESFVIPATLPSDDQLERL